MESKSVEGVQKKDGHHQLMFESVLELVRTFCFTIYTQKCAQHVKQVPRGGAAITIFFFL